MDKDNKTGQNEYYCDLSPKPDTNLQYKVDWSQTTKMTVDQLLHESAFVSFVDVKQFGEATKMTEENLKVNNVTRSGFTVF